MYSFSGENQRKKKQQTELNRKKAKQFERIYVQVILIQKEEQRINESKANILRANKRTLIAIIFLAINKFLLLWFVCKRTTVVLYWISLTH